MATALTAAYPYAGEGSQQVVTHPQWRNANAYFGCTDGVGTYGLTNVGNRFEAYGDSTGMQVKVKSGECWLAGTYGYKATETTLAIGGSLPPGGQARIARVVLRNHFGDMRIYLDILPGTNAAVASVAAPALTQNDTLWETSLAQVYIANGVSTITAGVVTDERLFSRGRGLTIGAYKDTAVDNLDGWLPCDGAAVSRITYAELFAEISTFYGVGNGTTTFNVPDKRGEVLAMFDGGASRLAGLTNHATHLGDDTHTLLLAELPPLYEEHVSVTVPAAGATPMVVDVRSTLGGATDNFGGSSTAHSIVQPTGGAWRWISARPT